MPFYCDKLLCELYYHVFDVYRYMHGGHEAYHKYLTNYGIHPETGETSDLTDRQEIGQSGCKRVAKSGGLCCSQKIWDGGM